MQGQNAADYLGPLREADIVAKFCVAGTKAVERPGHKRGEPYYIIPVPGVEDAGTGQVVAVAVATAVAAAVLVVVVEAGVVNPQI